VPHELPATARATDWSSPASTWWSPGGARRSPRIHWAIARDRFHARDASVPIGYNES